MCSSDLIKAGERGVAVADPLRRAAGRLVDRGAQAVIAGCTEIPLGLSPEDVDVPLVDPAVVLAQALIRRSYPLATATARQPEPAFSGRPTSAR